MKKFLERNKIFFETFAAVVLTGMALVVSWAQWRTAEEQSQLLEIQTGVAIQSVLPHFVITARQEKSSSSASRYDEDKIRVSNEGAVIHNFRCQSAVIFSVETYNWSDRQKNEKNFFVNGYYVGEGYTARGEGLLVTVEGLRNNARFLDLHREFSKKCKSKGLFGNIEMERFLHISYRDQLGKDHTEFYFIPLIYGATCIPDSKGKSIFRQKKESFGTNSMIEFEKVNADGLLGAMS